MSNEDTATRKTDTNSSTPGTIEFLTNGSSISFGESSDDNSSVSSSSSDESIRSVQGDEAPPLSCSQHTVRIILYIVWHLVTLLFHQLENITIACLAVFLDNIFDDDYFAETKNKQKIIIVGVVGALCMLFSYIKNVVKSLCFDQDITVVMYLRTHCRFIGTMHDIITQGFSR